MTNRIRCRAHVGISRTGESSRKPTRLEREQARKEAIEKKRPFLKREKSFSLKLVHSSQKFFLELMRRWNLFPFWGCSRENLLLIWAVSSGNFLFLPTFLRSIENVDEIKKKLSIEMENLLWKLWSGTYFFFGETDGKLTGVWSWNSWN